MKNLTYSLPSGQTIKVSATLKSKNLKASNCTYNQFSLAITANGKTETLIYDRTNGMLKNDLVITNGQLHEVLMKLANEAIVSSLPFEDYAEEFCAGDESVKTFTDWTGRKAVKKALSNLGIYIELSEMFATEIELDLGLEPGTILGTIKAA